MHRRFTCGLDDQKPPGGTHWAHSAPPRERVTLILEGGHPYCAAMWPPTGVYRSPDERKGVLGEQRRLLREVYRIKPDPKRSKGVTQNPNMTD
ncbi:MAG: hypothetical protein P9E24_08650 [Candidatus Competibacter sp.]|nr:hypothetical protein [Candidatus Competibacter sp.]MDG4585132.1 hypothetical protein [Candidatus Competibacter sp.]